MTKMSKAKQTYNPCDDCQYSYSKNAQESGMCKICEFPYFRDRKQSEGEWVRAENPPDEYRDEYGELIPFLVCCKGTVYPFRAMYDGTNWGDGIGVLKVTHWMPLPDPPKGE